MTSLSNPAGWKLVPIEPTDEMLAAGNAARIHVGADPNTLDTWRAMLTASPSPEALPAGGVDVERVAKAIVGPHKALSAGASKWSLDELREVRWNMLSKMEKNEAICSAKAVLALSSAPAPATVEVVKEPLLSERDQKIIKDWLLATRLHRGRSRLGKLLALRIADDLEADGVTEADIDRLLPAAPEMLNKVRSAYEKAKYQPGDYPIISHKFNTLMKELEAALATATEDR